ncbi:hypothetical protein EON73_01745 [bacterium]|nr:MAG: hypothetical protein EON73_01745 [bacterium]
MLTERLLEAAAIFDVKLLDKLISNNKIYYSILDIYKINQNAK